MPATEDSVLTSLNELRRLRKERRKKGHSAGGGGGNGRSQKAAAARLDPMGDQVTPPPRSDLALAAKGMRAGGQVGMGGTARAASAGFGPPGPVAATWDAPVDAAAFAQMARPTSSAKPAIVVAVLLLAAAGAGYVKLQNDTQALLADKDASIRRVEEARVQAVEASALAERQAQIKLKACEAKAATAPTTAAAAIAPAATAVVAPAPSAVSAPASSRRQRPSAARHASAAPAAPKASAEPTAVPQLPHKKRLDNDPLAGIKI
jgi:hypothetical protein